MSEFVKYTPTTTIESRSRQDFYNSIRDWLKSSDCFTQYFSFYEDTGNYCVHFNHKLKNLRDFPLHIRIDSQNVLLECMYSATSWTNGPSFNHSSFAGDPQFNVLSDDNNFIMTMSAANEYHGFIITGATDVDSGIKSKAMICIANKRVRIFIAGSSANVDIVEAECTPFRFLKTINNYIIRPYGVYNTALLFDNVYALDGGNDFPGNGTIIKINNKHYYVLVNNMIIKID